VTGLSVPFPAVNLSLPKTRFSLSQLNLNDAAIACGCHVHDRLIAVLFDSARSSEPSRAPSRGPGSPAAAPRVATIERQPPTGLSFTDRLLWVWLSQLWSGLRSALKIVKPETVIAWQEAVVCAHTIVRPGRDWNAMTSCDATPVSSFVAWSEGDPSDKVWSTLAADGRYPGAQVK